MEQRCCFDERAVFYMEHFLQIKIFSIDRGIEIMNNDLANSVLSAFLKKLKSFGLLLLFFQINFHLNGTFLYISDQTEKPSRSRVILATFISSN